MQSASSYSNFHVIADGRIVSLGLRPVEILIGVSAVLAKYVAYA